MRFSRTLITIVCIEIAFLVVGVMSTVNGITAMNASEIDYNNMNESEMGKYSHITGEIEFVLGCFAEGYTEESTFGIVTSQTTDSYYYLVECPYSPEDTLMILEAPANTEFLTDIEVLANETYYQFNLSDFTVPFNGYLERNESEILTYANEALTESGITDVKIAPYTINCTMADGFAGRCLGMGITMLVFFVVLLVVVLVFFIKGSRIPSFASSSSIYNGSSSRIGNEVDNSYGSPSNSRVEDYYGGTYRSNADNTDRIGTQQQYQSQPTQSSQTFRSQYQSQPTQNSQMYQSQYESGNYGSGSYGSGNYSYGNNFNNSQSDEISEDNSNSYPHSY